jgi:ketosteroid isomerase-like protein
VAIDRELNDDEAAFLRGRDRNSWKMPDDPYRTLDVDALVGMYAEDAISMPANRTWLRGHNDLREFYSSRAGESGDFETNLVTETDAIDIVGDIAVAVGKFRVTRKPEEGVAGLDHAGRYLVVYRRVDGEWKMWRDMDSPSPDADVFYHRLPPGK